MEYRLWNPVHDIHGEHPEESAVFTFPHFPRRLTRCSVLIAGEQGKI